MCPADLSELRSLLNLKELDVSNAALRPDAVASLKLALKNAKDLHELDLSDNPLGLEGVLALDLSLWPKLQVLELANVGLAGRMEMAPLGEALGKLEDLEELSLADNAKLGDQGLSALAPALRGCTRLRRLDLGNTGLTSASLPVLQQLLAGLPRLEQLNISTNALGQEAPSGLAAVSDELRVLSLRYTGFGDAGARQLGETMRWRMPKLAVLHLDGNDISGEGWKALAGPLRMLNVTMKELSLSNSGFKTAAKWEEALPHLQDMLSAMHQLEKLDVGGGNFVDGRLGGVLSGLERLETLDFSGIVSDWREWKSLCANVTEKIPKLEEMNLRDVKMPTEHLEPFLRSLAGKSNLEAVDARGIDALAATLLRATERSVTARPPFLKLQILRGGFRLTDVQTLLPEFPGVRLE